MESFSFEPGNNYSIISQVLSKCASQSAKTIRSNLCRAEQLLAGPAFIGVFTVSGVAFGLLADMLPRPQLFAAGVLAFSLAISGTGMASRYWHLVTLRMLLAAG